MTDKKVCTGCGVEKPLSEFASDKSHSDLHSSRCKECKRISSRKAYSDNPDLFNGRNKAYRDAHKKQIAERMKAYCEHNSESLKKMREEKYSKRAVILESLKTPCVKCGENRMYVIDFHHVDPKLKSFPMSFARSEKSLIEESKKCVCLCRNCHQEFHYFYGHNPLYPVSALNEYLKGGNK